MIRVIGERPLADRRWRRFNEVFSVPQNCKVDKIHGSFKNNVLTITMPKETITKMANLQEASKLDEKKLLEVSRRKEKEEEEAKQKKKQLLEEKEGLIKKLQEEAKAKEEAEMRKLEEEAKAKEKAKARKLQEEIEAKETLEKKKKKLEQLKRVEEVKERLEKKKKLEELKLVEEGKEKLEKKKKKKLEEEAKLRKIQESKYVDETGGKEKILKLEERKLPEVDYTKSSPGSSGTKSGSMGIGEVVKTAEEKLGNVVEKEKKMGKGIMEKITRRETTSEEKKLMVNVGVATLVIFALGAYVSYAFCSSSSSSSSSSSPSPSSSSTKQE